MKRVLYFLVSTFVVILFIGCGGNSNSSSPEQINPPTPSPLQSYDLALKQVLDSYHHKQLITIEGELTKKVSTGPVEGFLKITAGTYVLEYKNVSLSADGSILNSEITKPTSFPFQYEITDPSIKNKLQAAITVFPVNHKVSLDIHYRDINDVSGTLKFFNGTTEYIVPINALLTGALRVGKTLGFDTAAAKIVSWFPSASAYLPSIVSYTPTAVRYLPPIAGFFLGLAKSYLF